MGEGGQGVGREAGVIRQPANLDRMPTARDEAGSRVGPVRRAAPDARGQVRSTQPLTVNRASRKFFDGTLTGLTSCMMAA